MSQLATISEDYSYAYARGHDLETLLFSLGCERTSGREVVFGLDVSKVRAVMDIPKIYPVPNVIPGVVGVMEFAQQRIPVLNLATYSGVSSDTMMTTVVVYEHNNNLCAFLAQSIESVESVNWHGIDCSDMVWKFPAEIWGLGESTMHDSRTALMMDVDKVFSFVTHAGDEFVPFHELGTKQKLSSVQV